MGHNSEPQQSGGLEAGLPLARTGATAPDEAWSVPVGGDLAVTVERSRVTGESDDGVASRAISELASAG
jgi:hypothetical protein